MTVIIMIIITIIMMMITINMVMVVIEVTTVRVTVIIILYISRVVIIRNKHGNDETTAMISNTNT